MIRSRFEGCLLGGAVGDALGAPVEFMSLGETCQSHGRHGIRDLGDGRFTDDTQMTIFTVEGLLRAHNRWIGKGIVRIPGVVHRAYLRWLKTQGSSVAYDEDFAFGLSDQARTAGGSAEWSKSWLLEVSALHATRAPGSTCLSALRSGRFGTPDQPINNSKGCGGIMRIAPVGLAVMPESAFAIGTDLAAITHGHPSGYLAAGFFAAAISSIVRGEVLDAAIERAEVLLCQRRGHEETLTAVRNALALARSDTPVSAEAVESLGQGWVAEEALAIALYCALVSRTFREGVLLAVNHGGDSDSTGSLVGSLLGSLQGRGAIPADWSLSLGGTADGKPL